MPRLFHRPPKYALHKSTNQAVIYHAGERIYLGPFGSRQSHLAYRRFLKKWEKARHEQAAQSPIQARVQAVDAESLRTKRLMGSPITIMEVILVYRRHTHEYYRKDGEVTREAFTIDEVLRFLRTHHGMTYVDEFGPVALEHLREQMIDELDWSRSYINKQVNRIRGMFKWAAAKELVGPATSSALRSLVGLKKGRTRARETAGVAPVSDDVVDSTLLHLPPVVADMVRLQRLTSARPSEICLIRPRNLDTSNEVWVYRPESHKTEHFDKDRFVAIGPRGQRILKPYLERHPDSFCFSPRESETLRRQKATAARKTPVSCGNRVGSNRRACPRRVIRDCYTVSSFRRAIHRACENHGIEKWSPNRLRHTASTEIRKRFGLDAARAVDGHSSTTTTEIYAELDLQKAVNVMREVG